MPVIRYPGSKGRIYRHIAGLIPPDVSDALWQTNGKLTCYAEPFFGCGAVAFQLLPSVYYPENVAVIINDLDIGLVNMWKTIANCPGELKKRIRSYAPSPADFYRFKEEDGRRDVDVVESGFRKLVLHRVSYSGLGAMAGGPLGGRNQTSDYNPLSRWCPERMIREINKCHKQLSRFRTVSITCGDYTKALDAVPAHGFAYLDPPYYVQGKCLYKHPFAETDHANLAKYLQNIKGRFRWALSYDDHPHIRGLYSSWARIEAFEMTPSIQTTRKGKRRKNQEIVICNYAAS